MVDNFLTTRQRQDLIQNAGSAHRSVGNLQSSTDIVENDVSKQRSCGVLQTQVKGCSNFTLRNSYQSCPSLHSASTVENVHAQIKAVLPGLHVDQQIVAEHLVLTRYAAGGYYTEHTDGRRATVLMYLGGDGTEGATFFPNLGVRIEPKPGRALIFFPNTPQGEEKYCLSHAAEEVRSGEKWVAQVWLDTKARSKKAHGYLDLCKALQHQ
jgi:hypothetical protein